MSPVSISVQTVMFVLALFNIVATLFVALYLQVTGTKGSGLRVFVLAKLAQGLSWIARLAFYLGAPAWSETAADLLIVAGFALEAAIFLVFKGVFGKTARLVFGSLTGLAGILVLWLWGLSPEGKNLVILATYLSSMIVISVSLAASKEGGPFQRVLGLCYGALPLSSTILYAALYSEVTTEGAATTVAGTVYYVTIVAMQIIGSFGYLLLVKERDERRLAEIASRDSLTGVLNRRAFFERAEIVFANSARANCRISLLMMDLDHFKQLNDCHGHQAGDRAIRLFCGSVGGAVRKGDIFARHGGEEFVVLLPSASREESLVVAARIRENLAESGFTLDGEVPRFTISIGIATGIPERIEDIDRFIAASDEALYVSKRAGRDRVAWLGVGGVHMTPTVVLGPE